MDIELPSILFEWLLAEWAGYGDNPAELFPSLQGVSYDNLADEFVATMQKAGASEDMINKFRRKGEHPHPSLSSH